jgi:phenylpyruvate tautomerase PptA (4-oxalocrotonate tautomerase family)
MPFVRITIQGALLSAEQVNHLQQRATDLMTSIMRKPLQGTAVLVESVAPASWSIAGRLVDVAAHVDVIIGRGTNTSDEKTRFMADMMAALRTILGPKLRDETYLVLHEVDHASYGRGGLTRAERARREAAESDLVSLSATNQNEPAA